MQALLDMLAKSGGLGSIARDLGVDESQVASGASALLPALMGGFKNQAKAQPDGLDGMLGMLGGLGGGGLLDEVLAPKPTNAAPGNDILGQVFGSRDVSRTVAHDAASRTGLDPALVKKMLPLVAMAVAGYMAKQRGARAPGAPADGGGLGGLEGMLGGLLRGGGAQAGAPQAGGLGGLASMLDLDGDGNPLNDLLGMAGKLGR